MRNKAYEKVPADYSWDKVADQYDAFLRSYLGTKENADQ
jgi:hypothetical protein